MRDLLTNIQWRLRGIRYGIRDWPITLFIPKGAKVKLFEEYLKPHGPKDCTWRDVGAWRVDLKDATDPKLAKYAIVIYKGKAYQGEI